MNLKDLFRLTKNFVIDNLPTILSWVAVGGLAGSVATAVIDTPKAVKAIEEAKVSKLKQIDNNETTVKFLKSQGVENLTDIFVATDLRLTPWEYVKTLTPIYWKTMACCAVTVTCILMAQRVNSKRIAALVAAIGLRSKEVDEYKEKIKELFGEKKAEEITKELNKDRVMNAPIDEKGVVYTRHGMYLCYEPLTRTYFRSDINSVKAAALEMGRKMQREGDCSLADWCYMLDIELQDTYIEDRMVWEGKNPGDIVNVTFDYQGAAMSGEPCLVLGYSENPEWR